MTRVAIVGTFDVENFGDLLFPLLAEEALQRRLGEVEIVPVSYHRKAPPDWPYAVTPVAELPALAPGLAALLVGGGFLLRFDPDVAPGYGPPDAAVHHPTGTWLGPALVALQHDVPVVWNGPGMHCNPLPRWAQPLLALALAESRHVAVRDIPTRDALAPLADGREIVVTADTGFAIGGLLAARGRPDEVAELRRQAGLDGRYVVVQAAPILLPFLRWLAAHRRELEQDGLRFLVAPIGPVLGESARLVEEVDGLAGLPRLPCWPQPLALAGLIAGAEAVVGHSYHLTITALAHGVPAFSTADLAVGKYTALAGFGIQSIPQDGASPGAFLAALGRRAPIAAVERAVAAVEAHWDRVAAVVRAGRTATATSIGKLLLGAAGLVEAPLAQSQARLGASEAALATANATLDTIYRSSSWKLTAPWRAGARALRRLVPIRRS